MSKQDQFLQFQKRVINYLIKTSNINAPIAARGIEGTATK